MSEPLPEDEIPPYGGCVWPLDPACLGVDWDELDEDVQDRSAALASETLRRLTAYRVGHCPTTVRPCVRRGCWSAFVPFYGATAFHPGIDGHGHWVNGCGCQSGGSCATDCEIALPRPVGRVDEIKVDGAVLDDEDYEVRGNVIVWVGEADCPFPARQDLNLADTEPDTFSITYLNAYPVDALGAHAAGLLAVEFGKACTGLDCKLPPNVTDLARQGVSFHMEPGFFPNGHTGIDSVDAYVALWNPEARTHQSAVYSPDVGVWRSLR